MLKISLALFLPIFLYSQSLTIQVLGSGGPEFSKRSSSGYLLWVDNKAKVLVDAGGGTFLRFTQSGAKIDDLQAIALTHLHIDHSADLPQFMKAGFFTDRTHKLPILGTVKGGAFPDIHTYIQRLFGKEGAYAYMKDILTSQSQSFQIVPQLLPQSLHTTQINDIKISSIGVKHGQIPAIAFAFEIEGKKIVFSGDTAAQSENIIALAKGADYLIAHHAIPEHAGKFAKSLHMTPTRIGQISAQAGVKNLILSHRMIRTYDKEAESERLIKKHYKGAIIWAEDLMKIEVEK
ncbi:MAG: MBL fold metallo-hydrolase [Epsilonproteobacteria bacterium]|nr:MBL fold metallo-hydrolase [Campylobacterota bacterium]